MNPEQYRAALDERANLIQACSDILDRAAAENRELTDGERSTYDTNTARLATLRADIGRMETLREEQRAVQTADPEPARVTGVRDRATDDPKRGFVSLSEFANAVRLSANPAAPIRDDRLQRLSAPANEVYQYGGPGLEGYAVPPEFRTEIWRYVWDDPILAQFTFEPTSTGAVELNADESTPWGASGIQVYWRVERQQMTASRPTGIERRETRTHQMYALVSATNESLRDIPLIRNRLVEQTAEGITWKLVEALLRGTGAGMPLGILNSPPMITVPKETNQPADTIVAENLLNMVSRHIRTGGGRAFWLANPDTLVQLPTMTISTQPVWLAPNGLQSDPFSLGSLLGRPILESEHMSTLGDVGDIMLINTAGYHAIRRTTEPEFETSIHLWFDYNETAFRWTWEVGGQPYAKAPITPPHSNKTRSHFVQLAARA